MNNFRRNDSATKVINPTNDMAGSAAVSNKGELFAILSSGSNNIGDVDVASVTPIDRLYFGQKAVTTAGTELALASSQAITAGVYVKALAANTGKIYVGTGTVTSGTGFELSAKEQMWIPISNLATIVIDSSVNGEGVSYLGW